MEVATTSSPRPADVRGRHSGKSRNRASATSWLVMSGKCRSCFSDSQAAPARGHRGPGVRLHNGRGRGPQRRRDDQEPAPRPARVGRDVRRAAPPARVQDRLVRDGTGRRRPVARVIEDLLRLWEPSPRSQAVATHLHLWRVPSGPGPGRERRDQPRPMDATLTA